MKLFVLICSCTVLIALASGTPDEAVKAEGAASTPAPRKIQMSQGTVADRTRLVADLFGGDYNKHIIPDNVTVKFGMALINFDICAKKKVLSTYFWLRYVWKDSRLAWDPEEYGGTSVLRFDPNSVWRPDITLYNSADSAKMVSCTETNILMYSNGEVLWVPPCKAISHCPGLTLHTEPYEPQTCSLKFGSWTYDGNTMDLKFYDNKAEIDVSDMVNSSNFEFISTTAEKHERYYACCAEPYIDVTFNMTVQRRPGCELEQ